MLPPPNRLLWDLQVDDSKGCWQVGVTRGGASLFSSSITTWDLGNRLFVPLRTRSDNPNCKVQLQGRQHRFWVRVTHLRIEHIVTEQSDITAVRLYLGFVRRL